MNKAKKNNPSANKLKLSTWFGPMALAILVISGQVKQFFLFSWLPFDLTVVSLFLVVLSVGLARTSLGAANSAVAFPYLLWILFLPAALFTEANIDDSQRKLLTLYLVTLPMSVAPFYILRERRQRTVFLWAMSLVTLIVIFYGFVFSQKLADDYSSRLILDGSETIGSSRIALAAAIVFCLFAFRERFISARGIALWLASALTVLFSVSTGSRGPAIGALIALGITATLAPSLRGNRVKIAFLTFVFLALVTVFSPSISNDGLNRITSIFTGEGDTSTQARIDLWKNAIKEVTSSPFGIGWGAFEGKYGTHPHNLLLEVTVATGWFVATLFVCLLLLTFTKAVRNAVDTTNTVMLALLLFSFFNAMLSSEINGNRLLFVCIFAAWAMPLPDYGNAGKSRKTAFQPKEHKFESFEHKPAKFLSR